MKRIILLLCLILILSGCQENTGSSLIQPVNFYYQRAEMAYGVDDGVIASEIVDLQEWKQDYLQLMQRYLQGPTDDTLILPIPAGVELLGAQFDAQTIQVYFSRELSQLSGQDLTIACSCIAQTLLQFEQIQAVQIYADGALLDEEAYLEFTRGTVLFRDEGAVENQRVSLYFADENYRYLLETVQIVNDMTVDQLPEYLLEQLIAGPTTSGSWPVIPEGTMVLDVSVESGTCIVDFSVEFLSGKPDTWLEERTCIFAIVNTLAELEAVEQVQILVEGEALPQYLYLDLTDALVADETMIGPIRTGLGEFDATLCLPMEGRSGLFACPTAILSKTMEEPAQQALEALIAHPSVNGYINLLPEELIINSFVSSGRICMVDFSNDPLENCENTEQMELCIQSMVLTVSRTLPIELMQITVNGTPLQELHQFSGATLLPSGQYLYK